MEKEIWKAIVIEQNNVLYDYTGLYEVSNYGRVRSLNYRGHGKIKMLKQYNNGKGYLFTCLYKNGKTKHFYIHQLVARAFLENDNPEVKIEVNHKNENKEDNRAENLEWCDREYNINYGNRNKKQAKAISGRKSKTRKKVIAISLTENKVIVFQSMSQAEQLGFKQSNISACCQGELKQYKGYTWKYLNNKEQK